jgi:hypothetical protein
MNLSSVPGSQDWPRYFFLFRQTLVKSLDSAHSVIGSIFLKGSPFIETIKKRPDARLVRVAENSRNSPVEFLAGAIFFS